SRKPHKRRKDVPFGYVLPSRCLAYESVSWLNVLGSRCSQQGRHRACLRLAQRSRCEPNKGDIAHAHARATPEDYSSPSSIPALDAGAPPSIDGTPAGGAALALPRPPPAFFAVFLAAFFAGFLATFLAPPAFLAAGFFAAFFFFAAAFFGAFFFAAFFL